MRPTAVILYTVAPIEQVLEGIDRERRFVDMVVEGITMTVEPVSVEEAVIVRIISTDPRDFLNPALQPGRVIRLAPTLEARE